MPRSRPSIYEMASPTIRLVKVMTDGLVQLSYSGDLALWSRVKLRKTNDCAISGRLMQPGEYAFSPIGNQQYRARRIAADVMESNIEQWKKERTVADEKKVLAVSWYDLEDANLQPIDPQDATVQPGDRVELMSDYDAALEGDEGVVQAVGYAGGFFNCIVADVLRDDFEETDRIPQELLDVQIAA